MTMVKVCCAPPQPQEPAAWARAHFGQAQLGDVRRTRRLVSLAAALMGEPGMSLPKQLPDWADLTAAYRLLSNAQILPQAIRQPHCAWTRQLAAAYSVVLCVQDDTQLDFTCRTGISGLGITGDGHGRGLLQHTALAVLPEGSLLGMLDLAFHAVAPAPKGETRRQRQARWNVRDVWHEAAQSIGPWHAHARLVHVGDRHSDVFRFMDKARQWDHDWVLRAMHDRYVDDDADHLWSKLAGVPALGQMTVTLGAQRDGGNRLRRTGREATLTIRTAAVLVAPPRNDPRTQDAAPLTLWAMYLVEEHPPVGEEAVEWMLLTNLEAGTLEQARTLIGYYTCRWVIEEWHRCLKEGCRVEQSQLDEALDIQRLVSVLAVVAVRMLQMRDGAEGGAAAEDTPERLREQVPPLWVTVVAGLAKTRPETLTPRKFWQAVAKRGGYLGRKNDPRPGWKVLWRGWRDLLQIVCGAELYRDSLRS